MVLTYAAFQIAGAVTGALALRAILGQGWKRQLRRMFGAVGAPVARLVRVRVGSLRLDLATGAVRPLTAAEVRRLGASTYHPEAGTGERRRQP